MKPIEHNYGDLVQSAMKKKKIEKTMHEFKVGNLHSGSKHGKIVTNPKQALAISLSQARKV